MTIALKYARNNYRLHFFTNSVIGIWNQLPQEVVEATSLTLFKSSLAAYFLKNDIMQALNASLKTSIEILMNMKVEEQDEMENPELFTNTSNSLK